MSWGVAASVCVRAIRQHGNRNHSTSTPFQIFNSVSRKLEPLKLLRPSVATWYACGPTVYDVTHIGHARTYIAQDVIRRILMHHGINVFLVMNVTDVDDKIIERAKSRNVLPKDLADTYERDFFDTMSQLNVLPPNVVAKVTDFIPEIILFIQRLLKKNFAYRTSLGNVYFDVNSYVSNNHAYGIFQAPQEGQSIDTSGDKKNSHDFALWKQSHDLSFSWPSPWGSGRPGWHIECSSIAKKLIGAQMDLHSGGIDLQFPHHENEIAQCCAYEDVEWCNQFLHFGHLHIQGRKMSKSLKNFISVDEMIAEHGITARQFRLFCLSTHYRSSIEFKEQTMENIKKLEKRYKDFLICSYACLRTISNSLYYTSHNPVDSLQNDILLTRVPTCQKKVDDAMKCDFDTPAVLSLLQEEMSFANRYHHAPMTPSTYWYLQGVCALIETTMSTLGVPLEEAKVKTRDVNDEFVDDVSMYRMNIRKLALAARQGGACVDAMALLHLSDVLRDKWKKAFGIEFIDSGETSYWKKY